MTSQPVKHDSPAMTEVFVIIAVVTLCTSFTEIKSHQNIWYI